jgi:hypothetical protein
MSQNVEELLAPLPNMRSQRQRQQDGDYVTPKAVRRIMERSESLNQLDPYGFNLPGSNSQVHPSKGVSQFKTPLRLQSGMQPNPQLELGRRGDITPGSPSSKGVSQFKTPLRLQSAMQPNPQLEPGRRDITPGSLSSKGVSQFKAPLRLQSGMQSHKQLESGRPSSAFGVPSFNDISPLSGSTRPLPSTQVIPSVGAHATYFADAPVTPHNGILTIHPTYVPITPESGLPALISPLEGQRQWPSPQAFRKPDQSLRSAHPWPEAQVKPQSLHRTKTRITMKIILFGGAVLLAGGIASFLLLPFPTYLVVAWVVLLIIFSNLVSRELRSSYRLMLTTRRLAAVRASSHDDHMGRNPLLKDISDTTAYLKALCLVFKNDHPVQAIPPERKYKG